MSKKRSLFDENDDDEGGVGLSINNDYAQRYDKWRESELKVQLENKYGNVESSSSDDESDPEELQQIVGKDFFELMSKLKKKDPKIYDSNVQFFKNEQNGSGSSAKKASKKEKPLYLRDYERKIITEREGRLSDDDSDAENNLRSQSPTYVEEQQRLKESLVKAFNEDDDEDGFLKIKEKTEEEKTKEDEDYIEWLKGNKESLPDKETEDSLKPLKSLWTDPKLDANEKFLRDYLLEKKYLFEGEVDETNVVEEDILDKDMDDYERKYNFRYEEPDKEFLKHYPRNLEQSSRQKDTRRKEARDAVKKRKEEEKMKKREELKLLKSLKRKEIQEKIEKLKKMTGNEELAFNPDELEEDFDSEAHDRRMNELFNNDDYYGKADEDENEEGLNLPPLEEELLDDGVDDCDWDNWDGTADPQAQADAPHCDDPNFNMDCDFDPATAQQNKEQSSRKTAREKRKLKRQSRFGRLVHKQKPVFDPKDSTFQEYVDEYYGMDYEDLIGDMPCRFKYKKVFPNSYGLTIDEILAADDKELNQWISKEKLFKIRPEHFERNDAKVFAEKARNEALKRKILPSLYKHETENVSQYSSESQAEGSSKKKKKKKKTEEELEHSFDETAYHDPSELQEEGTSKKKKDKKKKSISNETNETALQDPSELQDDGFSKKKKDKKKPISDETDDHLGIDIQAEGTKKKKKKKKKKNKNKPATDDTNETIHHNPPESLSESGTGKKKSPTAHASASDGHPGNKSKRKRQGNEVQCENGAKKARTFGQEGGAQKKFKNKNSERDDKQEEQQISDSRLKAYGFNPKKFKKKQKYGSKM